MHVCNFNGILELLYGRSPEKAASSYRKRDDVLGAQRLCGRRRPISTPSRGGTAPPRVDFANI